MANSLSVFSGFSFEVFLLVFMRMSGMFIFNPILGRENIPTLLRAAMGFICALVVTPTLSGVTVRIGDVAELIVMSLGELFVGLAVGVVVSTILYIVQFAGELIDMQMGLTMAKMYDPHTGVSMPLLGNFFNVVMILCFFASNAHLTLISYITDSFKLIAPGAVFPTQQSLHFVVALVKDYFELGLRMAMPVIAIEIISQIAIGMLMRAVPSINIFSIGMHLTALVGLVIVFITLTTIVTMCGQLITYMIEKVAQVIKLMAVS